MEGGRPAIEGPAEEPLRELPQQGFYKLRKKGDASYFVEHSITGEVRALPCGGRWFLANRGDRVWAGDALGGHPPVWMSRLLRTSMWMAGQRVLVAKQARGNDPATSDFLDDMARRHRVDAIKLNMSIDGAPISCPYIKLYLFDLPKDGARVFWELDHFKYIVGAGKKDIDAWFRHGVRQRWMPWVVKHCTVPEDHFLPGACGVRSRDAPWADFLVHKNSVSTSALLCMMRRWVASLENAGSRRCATLVLKTVLAIAPRNFHFAVPRSPNDVDQPLEFYDVVVENGYLRPCPQLATANLQDPCVDECGWPFRSMLLLDLACPMQMRNVAVSYVALRSLGAIIEHHLLSRHTETQALARQLADQENFYIDPMVRQLSTALGRNAYRLHRIGD